MRGNSPRRFSIGSTTCGWSRPEGVSISPPLIKTYTGAVVDRRKNINDSQIDRLLLIERKMTFLNEGREARTSLYRLQTT